VNRVVLPSPDPERKQCYFAFSQGPCQSGEWYIFNLKTRKPECQRNPCSFHRDSSTILGEPQAETDVFTFSHEGTCYRTHTKGFCPEDHQFVRFQGTNDPYPSCFSLKYETPCPYTPGVGPQVGMACGPGFKLVGDECTKLAIGGSGFE
jgi:hypothetical protein